MQNNVSFIPLGGIGDVSKNMYLYEAGDEILIVDCGLGFANETMLGVDLLLPDISYLLKRIKSREAGSRSAGKIVGMLLTHGHEDHMGALPFVLPQIKQNFPIFATNLTQALANEKLKEFGVRQKVSKVEFNQNIKVGNFQISFIRMTHSIPDTSHIFIRTPVGNFYHGSDFKLDPTPYDGKTSDLRTIEEVGREGVLCLMSDCLGAERPGKTPSEIGLTQRFEKEIKSCQGKFIVTTYSSHISRLNQIIEVSQKNGRKVCFVGRSLIRAKETAKRLGYLHLQKGIEVEIHNLKNFKDHDLTLIIAGSQGQEDSAMARIASGEHREIKLNLGDTVIISADPIPGNETSVYELIDTIAKKDVRIVYSDVSSSFHVSGHGSQEELSDLIELVRPKNIIPISGNFRHIYAYKNMALNLGFKKQNILLLEDGRQVIFTKEGVRFGKTIPVRNVYVDEVSGEKMENFILRDRQKLSEGGIVIILAEISSLDGQLVERPDIIIRGFSVLDIKILTSKLVTDIRNVLKGKRGRVTNWQHIKKIIQRISERRIFKELHRSPLVLPVVIEV